MQKLVRFFISGAAAVGTNLGCLYLFTEYLEWWYLFSSVLAFTIGTTLGFGLQKYWAFQDGRSEVLGVQASYYTLLQVWDIGLNAALLYTLVEYAGWWYFFAQAVVSALIAIQNFCVYYLIFRPPSDASQ